jgi:hypothetical protein
MTAVGSMLVVGRARVYGVHGGGVEHAGGHGVLLLQGRRRAGSFSTTFNRS